MPSGATTLDKSLRAACWQVAQRICVALHAEQMRAFTQTPPAGAPRPSASSRQEILGYTLLLSTQLGYIMNRRKKRSP